MAVVSPVGLFNLALANLRINIFRSFLTVLGMVFGTGAVIATLSSSEGAQRYIAKELENLGTNILTIYPPQGSILTEGDLASVRKYATTFANVTRLQPAGTAQLRSGITIRSGQIYGVDREYFATAKLNLARGRLFTHEDEFAYQPVIVLGDGIREQIFGEYSGLGELVHAEVGGVKTMFQVIGTLKRKGGPGGASFDSAVYMPKDAARAMTGAETSGVILATLKSDDLSKLAKDQVQAILFSRFENGLEVSDAREAIERTKNIWEKQNVVGIALALVSLLTGGVGIMNIMLLSIHERRREIGLRKAVGASNAAVAIQFLLEAVIICFIGGMLGVAAGWAFGQQVAKMMGQWEAVTSAWTVCMALGFSMLTGVIFGLLPAVRASRLDPYDALRA